MIDSKKVLAVLLVSTGVAFGVSPSSNTVWNISNGSGATNDIAQLDKSGNLKVDGTITAPSNTTHTLKATGATTVNTLTATNTVTLSVTAGKLLVGTNIGATVDTTFGTNKVKIVNGIITGVGLP